MTNATSLILIATGAILAFAVNYEIAGISIKTVGAILIVVGSIGLAFAVATLAGYAPWGAGRAGAVPLVGVAPPAPTNVGPPASL